jgi:hypothetical protein
MKIYKFASALVCEAFGYMLRLRVTPVKSYHVVTHTHRCIFHFWKFVIEWYNLAEMRKINK